MSHPASSYDDLPYEDLAFYHTHPNTLAVVAGLCGLDPPPVGACRVLEIGCGTGLNLVAMSQSVPGSRFVGVDPSCRQVDAGRALAAAVGAGRVEFHACGAGDLGEDLGVFDYVVCHGVYSWVPAAAREAILAACRRHLAPGGVAYVSYNTYPGWHGRSAVRDVLRFHAPPGLPPAARARAARAGLDRTVAALPDPDGDYARALRGAAAALRDDSDVYLFHEYLEEENHPVTVEAFTRAAAGHGLRFLAEARYGTNSFAQTGAIGEALAGVGDDLVRREQYLDLLWNRSFRQTLLVHAAVVPPRRPEPAAVGRLRILGEVEPLGGAAEAAGERFRVAGGEVVTTADPVLRGILHGLRAAWPRAVPVGELAAVAVAEADLGPLVEMFDPTELITPMVVRGYAEGMWQLFAYDPPFAPVPGDRPVACPLARHQAGRGAEVTTRLHRPATLSAPDRALLRLLDGRAGPEELADELSVERAEVEAGLRRLAGMAVLAG